MQEIQATKQKPNPRQIVQQKFLLVTIIAILMALYFWGHNLSLDNPLRLGLFTMGRITLDLGAVLLLGAIAGGIGRRIFQSYDFSQVSKGERAAIESSIGLGIISLIALIMGLLGFFNGFMWLVIAVLAIPCFRDIIAWFKDFGASLWLETHNPWESFISRFVIIALLGALLLALAPPFAWDGINYHLVIPERYLAEGVIRAHFDSHFYGFPQAMEMLNALLMLLTGAGRAPAVLHFFIGLLGLMAIHGLVARIASSKAAFTALLLLMASFNLWQLFSWPYVDLALLSYSVVAIIAITEWRKTAYQRWQWLIIAALAAGFSAGVKYTAFPLLLGLGILVIVSDKRQFLRNGLIFGGIALIVFSPWLLKGLLLYQNPLYPYIFPSPNWDEIRAMNFSESGKGLLHGDLLSQIQIPLLPFAATIFGNDKITPYRFTAGVFLLTLPFALLLVWKHLSDEARKLSRDILIVAGTVLLFWMITAAFTGIGGQTRLMIVGIPLAAILGSIAYHGIENWPRRPIDMVFITQATMIIALFLGLFDYLSYFAKSRVLEYQAGAISEDEYLGRNLGILYGAMLAIEEHVPEGSSIQMLWESKAYYCPAQRTCIGDFLFDIWARPIRLGTSPEALLEEWRSAGVDYFLLYDVPESETQNPEGFSLWLDYHEFAYEQNRLFPEYFYPATQVIWTDGIGFSLYTWKE